MASDNERDSDDVLLADVIRELTRIFGSYPSSIETPQFDFALAINSPSDTLEFLRSIPTGAPPEQILTRAREFEMRLADRRHER